MKNILQTVTLALFLLSGNAIKAQSWTSLITDACGDATNPFYPDGKKLQFRYDCIKDSLWFRMELCSMPSIMTTDFGVNIMVNYPGGGSTFNFWGNNNTFPYHKLATAWVT